MASFFSLTNFLIKLETSEQHACPHGKLDETKFGSPIPSIGLYIAFATLVCFVCMVFDLLSGFHRRKPWLPCKLFSLNSFTLTLATIATKLSVDLTIAMPRVMEQLSKLTSSALLCIFMAFFMPSLASSVTSECIANLSALSVLVVTVIVDVIVQISTGMIFAFIVEHVALLICMALLLVLLISSSLQVNSLNHNNAHKYRGETKKTPSESGLKGMRQHLEKLYAFSCSVNPQFLCCETSNCSSAGLLCGGIVAVVSEAAIRSFAVKEKKFCEGVSYFGWSVRWVVVSHFLAIVVGAIVVCFRWLTMIRHRSVKSERWKKLFENETWLAFASILSMGFKPLPFKFHNKCTVKLYLILKFVIRTMLLIMNVGITWASELVVFSCLIVRKAYSLGINTNGCEETRYLDFILPNLYEDDKLDKWIATIAGKKIKRLKKVSKREVPTQLIGLLSKKFPPISRQSESLLSIMQHRKQKDSKLGFDALSSYSVETLVKIATYSISNSLGESLHEALELIYFVEKKIKPESFQNRLFDLQERLERITEKCWRIPKFRSGEQEDDLQHALTIIKTLRDTSITKGTRHTICDSILESEYASITELAQHIEQALVDIMRAHLVDLPIAIFREYSESPIEECELRTRRAVKFMCMLEVLEKKVPKEKAPAWQWPSEFDMNKRDTKTVTLPVPAINGHANADPRHSDETNQEIQAENIIDIDHLVLDEKNHEIQPENIV